MEYLCEGVVLLEIYNYVFTYINMRVYNNSTYSAPNALMM